MATFLPTLIVRLISRLNFKILPFRFIDVDGEINGIFDDKDVTFDWKNAEQTKPGKGWYAGEWKKTINAELTPKAPETDE